MSSASDTLHCVVRAPRDGEALALALATAVAGDVILLMQDGVLAAVSPNVPLPPGVRGFVLEADLARRGMTRAADSSFLAIDASGFVALAAGALRQVCWA